MGSEGGYKSSRMDVLGSMVNVDENLTFIEKINNKYDWRQKSNEISERLAEIRSKQEDKNLNLSVIGEFSTGKSTFINALIRNMILESDVLQGTTAAATVIRYGVNRNILIKRTVNGTDKTYEIMPEHIKDEQSFIKKVTEATTKKTVDSSKETVIIEYPSETLRNNIVIVDTPGTNVTETWHEEITSNAIHKLSDASIIVIDAVKLVPMTLINFINNNLIGVIKNCVFVVNRIDLLRPKERERQLEYIRTYIADTFDIKDPIVCPYSALFVLGNSVPKVIENKNYEKDDFDELVAKSYQTESVIYSYLAKRRIIIQYTKLLELIDHTFDVLQSNMKNQIGFYENKHKEIEASKIINVDKFMQDKINQSKEAIISSSFREISQFESYLKEGLRKKKENIRINLNSLEDRKYLVAYANNLSNNMQKAANEVVNAFLPIVLECINQAERTQWGNFFEDFKNQYQRLAVQGNKEDYGSDVITIDNNQKVSVNISTELTQASNKYQMIGDAANVGGAAGGAVLGQLIIPIPVVGAAIGLMAGWLFGDKIGMPVKKMKADYWAKMEPVIDQYFRDITNEYLAYVNKYQTSATELIKQKIMQCKEKYNVLIYKIDQQDNDRQKELQKHLSEIEQDLMILEKRKETLQSSRGVTSRL